MRLRKVLPTSNYIKADRAINTCHTLSDGAKTLYTFLCGWNPSKNINDAYIQKALNISEASLTRRKQELRAMDLLVTVQVSVRKYEIYVGCSTFKASKIKELADKEEEMKCE